MPFVVDQTGETMKPIYTTRDKSKEKMKVKIKKFANLYDTGRKKKIEFTR